MNGYVVTNSKIGEKIYHPESSGKPPAASHFGKFTSQSLLSLLDIKRHSLTEEKQGFPTYDEW